MPVRVEKQVERDGLNGKPFRLTETQWREHDELMESINEHNEEVSKEVTEWRKQIAETFGNNVKVVVRAFNTINEEIGKALIKPRNYLSLEVIEIETPTGKLKYLLADSPDMSELSETIIQDLHVKERKKTEPKEDGASSNNLAIRNGREPRKSGLARYAEAVCESIASVQPKQSKARRNFI